MKIEIWSDVMCPFCYIGKRNFEKALELFADKDQLEIIWRSYQLNPEIPEVATDSYENYLVKHKGMSVDQVREMLANVTQSAKQVGLDYHFDKTVMVNSLSAQKLVQFANTKGLGDQLEERLFRAFFTEGENIADLAVLTRLGKEVGLDEKELQLAFTDDNYAYLVQQDIAEARQIGVQGVPFFVMDRKYAVSGAQPMEMFLENLERSFLEWEAQNSKDKIKVSAGQSCTADGKCE